MVTSWEFIPDYTRIICIVFLAAKLSVHLALSTMIDIDEYIWLSLKPLNTPVPLLLLKV